MLILSCTSSALITTNIHLLLLIYLLNLCLFYIFIYSFSYVLIHIFINSIIECISVILFFQPINLFLFFYILICSCYVFLVVVFALSLVFQKYFQLEYFVFFSSKYLADVSLVSALTFIIMYCIFLGLILDLTVTII